MERRYVVVYVVADPQHQEAPVAQAALPPVDSATAWTLLLESGRRWQFAGASPVNGVLYRLRQLFQLHEAADTEGMTARLFPFYPLGRRPSYTFFDYTHDILAIHRWLDELDDDAVVQVREAGDPSPDWLADFHLLVHAMAIDNERQGGFVVHGVLMEREGQAIVLAAASGVGKTTAAGRFPAPWAARSDDQTLVVKGHDGTYYAHPWPGCKAYPWFEVHYDVPRGIPLKAVLFLVRDPVVEMRAVSFARAVAMLERLVDQAMELPDPSIDPDGVGKIRGNRMGNLTDFVQSVECLELRLNQTDPFWEDIDALLFKDE